MNYRQYARQYFVECQLSYKDITIDDLNHLIKRVNQEIGTVSETCLISMCIPLKKDIKFTKDGLDYAYLKVCGDYFSKRDAIYFNSNGEIAFASWADDLNIQPIVKGFVKWCDYLKDKKKLYESTI